LIELKQPLDIYKAAFVSIIMWQQKEG